MSALLTTLPGDIFTTFLRGTPIFVCGTDAVIHGPDTRPEVERHGEWCASPADDWKDDIGEWIPDGVRSVRTSDIEVDLGAEIGRAFVAWWCRASIAARGGWNELTTAHLDLLMHACDGHPFTPEQIDMLARLVLRLSGRTP